MGDASGRRLAMLVSLSLVVVGALGSALVPWGTSAAVWTLIIITRLISGIGIGGIFPLAATMAMEGTPGSDTGERAAAAAWAFVARNASMVFMIAFAWLLSCWPGHGAVFAHSTAEADVGTLTLGADAQGSGWSAAWRLLLGAGAFPSLAVMRTTFLVPEGEEHAQAKSVQVSPWAAVSELGWAGAGKPLLATALGWFFFDVVAYGLTITQPVLLAILFPSDSTESTFARGLLLNVGCVAASWGYVWMLRRYSARWLQVQSCGLLAVLTGVLGLTWPALHAAHANGGGAISFILFCLTAFTCQLPAVTFYLLPTEVFHPGVRTTLGGVSTATGKLGSITGVLAYSRFLSAGDAPELRDRGLQLIFGTSAVASAAAAALTVVGIGLHGSGVASSGAAASGEREPNECSALKPPASRPGVGPAAAAPGSQGK